MPRETLVQRAIFNKKIFFPSWSFFLINSDCKGVYCQIFIESCVLCCLSAPLNYPEKRISANKVDFEECHIHIYYHLESIHKILCLHSIELFS